MFHCYYRVSEDDRQNNIIDRRITLGGQLTSEMERLSLTVVLSDPGEWTCRSAEPSRVGGHPQRAFVVLDLEITLQTAWTGRCRGSRIGCIEIPKLRSRNNEK